VIAGVNLVADGHPAHLLMDASTPGHAENVVPVWLVKMTLAVISRNPIGSYKPFQNICPKISRIAALNKPSVLFFGVPHNLTKQSC
jgi:hypothetical protein